MARYHPAYLGPQDRLLQLYRADPFGSTGQLGCCCSSEALPDDGRIIAQSHPSYNNFGGQNSAAHCWRTTSNSRPGHGHGGVIDRRESACAGQPV